MSLGSIGPDVKMVILNFSFSNPDDIPEFLLNKEDKRQLKNTVTLNRVPVAGKRFVSPTDSVSIKTFYDELYFANYRLVDAYAKMRNTQYRAFWVARFVFALLETQKPAEHTKGAQKFLEMAKDTCVQMCRNFIWQVTAHRNPFFKDEKLVPGVFCVAVDLNRPSTQDPRMYLVINDDQIVLTA